MPNPNEQNEQNEQAELDHLFERTSGSAQGIELTRMSARAQDIPGKASRWAGLKLWLPLGLAALGAASAAWVFGGSNPGPPALSEATGRVAVTGARDQDSPRGMRGPATEEGWLSETEDESEGLGGEASLNAAALDPNFLLAEGLGEESEMQSAFEAEDLFGPTADADVELWLLATNDLLGGGG